VTGNQFFERPILNRLRGFGRRAFAEFADVYQIESDFGANVEGNFAAMIERVAMGAP
jgi:type III restriction enzyme